VTANPETEKLITWLRREAKQGAGLVSLTHHNVGGFGASIGKWPVAEDDTEPLLAKIADDLYRAACDDADGQSAPGPQQYFAHYFAENDLRTPVSRLPFLVVAARQVAFGPTGEGIASEPPTQSGFVAQVMRHSDATQTRAWTIVGHALGMMERHTGQVSQENAYLRQSNFELARGYEGLLSERHIRELAAQNAMHDRNERTQFWNRMWLLAPAVISKIGGGTGPNGPRLPLPPGAPPSSSSIAPQELAGVASDPASPNVLGVQIRSLFDSLSGEQLAALQGTLTVEQFVALGAIWNSLPNVEEPPAPPPPPPEEPR
jgi:hypothetical protein